MGDLGWKDPWRRKRQPTPVLLPRKSHGRRSLAGYRVGHDWVTSLLSFQLLSLAWPLGSWTAVCQASLPFTSSWTLLKLLSIESVMPFNHLILCHSVLLPSVFPSIRGFSNQLALCIRWLNYWNFSISPSSEYSWLISFRIDWFDLLAVQGTLKSLLQQHNWKHQFSGIQPSLWSNSHIHT